MITRLAAILSVCAGVSLIAGACSMTEMAADSTVDIMKAGAPALAGETDLELAEAALVGNLKMMEGLYQTIPENEGLLRLLGEAYSSYGFGFLEPRLWPMAPNSDEADALRGRIAEMYRRALRYTRERLALVDDGLNKALDGNPVELKKRLQGVKESDSLDALFWVAQAWSFLINTDPDDLEQMANLPTVQAVMEHIVATRPQHEDGSALIFIGVSNAALGRLGGDLPRAKAVLEQADAINEGGFLVPRYMMGRYYCQAINSRECFVEHLGTVAGANVKAIPHRTLSNVLAQSWARYWLTRQDDLF